MKKEFKSKAVLMSARANVFYLQRVRVCQDAERVVYLARDGNIDKVFNIPEKNTAFIFLGKGTSITDSAVRKLAESRVAIGFCGTGGSPMLASVSPVFLESQSEYGPTEYMQGWGKLWFDEESRLNAAKDFFRARIVLTKKYWRKILELEVNPLLVEAFEKKIESCDSTTQLLSAEASWAKGLYAQLARHYKIKGFIRRQGDEGGDESMKSTLINDLLDHGNYIAYGYAATVLTTLGISYAFPLLHGKTRRGALVFDVADLFKDGIVMALAFKLGSEGVRDEDFRGVLIENCWNENILDTLFDIIKKISLS